MAPKQKKLIITDKHDKKLALSIRNVRNLKLTSANTINIIDLLETDQILVTENNTNYRQIIDLIKYPIITDKATRLLEINQYAFATDPTANKTEIKTAIEYLFQVKV